MSQRNKALQRAIDRMVGDAIRRILPEVMNEVLIRTVANAGVLREAASIAPSKPQPKRQAVQQRKPARPRPGSLSELLDVEAGTEFYQDPRQAMREHTTRDEPDQDEDEQHEDGPNRPPVSRIAHLSPELQALAEGMELDDDGGEMWDDSELSTPTVLARADEIRDPNVAAERVGVDFSRMAKVIKETSKKDVRKTAADVAAEAQFQQQVLERRRAQLERKA